MLILGLQKTTLLDYPEKIAATIFTGGCDLRCHFCHNKDLVFPNDCNSKRISESEIISFLEKRRNTLQAICISGGEPSLQPDLLDFMKRIKDMGYLVKLDTNGLHPEILEKAISSNLIDYVAMDIKNTKQKYEFTVGTYVDLTKLEASFSILRESNITYEFRTTIVKEFHTDYDLDIISKWISFAPAYYLQSYIDSGNTISPGLHAHDVDTLKYFLEICKKNQPNTYLRGVEI